MTLPIPQPRNSQSTTPPKRQKYFVSRKETLTIRCRSCGRINTIPVASLKERKHSMQVNCACGQSFEIDLEFRQDFRQKSHITGSFRALSTPKSRARQCIIADHSNGGLLLTITEDVPIKQDDRLIVCYRPTPDEQHEIERVITVRHFLPGSHIGGAFTDVHPHLERRTSILH